MYASTSSSERGNLLRAIRFETPDYIPMTFHINDACWHHYEQDALLELIQTHPFLFPNFQRPATPYVPDYDDVARVDSPHTDGFGCVWKTADNGITGSVNDHPLADWAQVEALPFPDPDSHTGLRPVDWAAFEREVAAQKAAGVMTYGDLRHGHTFQQLVDLRGYMELMCDMAAEEPKLPHLLERLLSFNQAQIAHFLRAGVDMVRIPEDLGMQNGPMLTPDQFRQYIKPCYQAMIAPVRDAGAIVHMHSDGDIRTLAEDIIDGGVQVLNLQDLVNGLDWIAENLAGKLCIDLDIDRQSITPRGTPAQIDQHIRTCVARVGRREGGLMMIYGLYPNIPLENIKAVMDAMERYAGHYSG